MGFFSHGKDDKLEEGSSEQVGNTLIVVKGRGHRPRKRRRAVSHGVAQVVVKFPKWPDLDSVV